MKTNVDGMERLRKPADAGEGLATGASGPSGDDAPLPGTPFTPRQVRLLKIVVAVMGVLLVAGLVLVVSVIVYRTGRLAGDAAGRGHGVAGRAAMPAGERPAVAALALPQGARVTAMALDGDRLAVQVESPAGGHIVVLDLATGRTIARVRLTKGPRAP